MIDFPNSPTVGQIFSGPNGSFSWDGTKWMPHAGCGGTITINGDVSGSGVSTISTTVVGMQSRPVDSTAPALNQAIAWNGTDWFPTDVLLHSGDTLDGGNF